jgi:putative restriction endonuclease
MGKAVLVSNRESIYDDVPEIRYHFPKQYLGRIKNAVGDWIIYYESGSNNGRRAYFATARLVNVIPDTSRADHFYGYVSDYSEFPNPVAWRHERGYWETAFGNDVRRPVPGLAQNAVRAITDREYEAILEAGFATILNVTRPAGSERGLEIDEAAASFERPIVESIVAKPFRDAAFTTCVRAAYDSTCAATGLKLVNGEGRCEIEAAHIRPVGDGHKGPDSVRNGLALSRTVHWLFDRGLVSLQDDGKILFASKRHFPEIDKVRSMLNADGYMRFPSDPLYRPHRLFLQYHRDTFYAPKAE